MEFKEMLKGEEYGFLRENKHLGRHVILLGVAGVMLMGQTERTVILIFGGLR